MIGATLLLTKIFAKIKTKNNENTNTKDINVINYGKFK